VTEIVRHTSAGEKGRIYSRRRPVRKRVGAPAAMVPANPPAAGPHPGLLEHLGPAYVATPDGTLTWHNDAFVYLARAAWNLPDETKAVTTAPEGLRNVFETLTSTGHFDPSRTRAEIGGVARTFRGRHFLGDSNGTPVIYGYFEDISRWIASEQRLAALDDKLSDVIRSTSDWVWETDTDMRLTEVSARIAAITGAPPGSASRKACPVARKPAGACCGGAEPAALDGRPPAVPEPPVHHARRDRAVTPHSSVRHPFLRYP